MSADDGLPLEAAFAFSYEPDAARPVSIPLPDDASLAPPLLVAAVLAPLIVAVAVLVIRRRRSGTDL